MGAAHGRGHPDRLARRRLLPRPAALPGRRSDRRCGEGMSSVESLALRCIVPGFIGSRAPDWVLKLAAAGLGGVALFVRNVDTPEQVTTLTASLHYARPSLLTASDEDGGSVT